MSQEKIDADTIRKALKDNGTDDEQLIEIAVKRGHKQRIKIRQKYKEMFGIDLMSDLKSDLTGDYKTMMLALFTDPVEFDVDNLHKAMKGETTDEDTLIEILASRPCWYLNKIQIIYKEKYQTDLEEDIIGDSSSDLRKILLSLLQNERSTNKNPDKNECKKIAEKLNKPEERSLRIERIHESFFINVFILSSPHELVCISKEYHKITGNTLIKTIEEEFSIEIRKLLRTILYALISPSEYFATRIHDAIDGIGTNEKILTRVLVTRAEIDLPKIKQYYQKLYGKDMIKDIIKDDMSSNYSKLLQAIYNQYIQY